MATKVKPSSSGVFTTITSDATGCCDRVNTVLGFTPPYQQLAQIAQAINEWHNAPAGTGAAAAASRLGSFGVAIQEV
jgi:hypothetical protein